MYFQMLALIADNDLTKFDNLFNKPWVWILTIAEYKLKQNDTTT